MAPVIVVEVIRQLFKFGGSYRKEAIAVAITPAFIAVYETMSKACVDGCTVSQAFWSVTGMEWAALITGFTALVVHLYAKAKAATTAGE